MDWRQCEESAQSNFSPRQASPLRAVQQRSAALARSCSWRSSTHCWHHTRTPHRLLIARHRFAPPRCQTVHAAPRLLSDALPPWQLPLRPWPVLRPPHPYQQAIETMCDSFSQRELRPAGYSAHGGVPPSNTSVTALLAVITGGNTIVRIIELDAPGLRVLYERGA